MAQSIEDNTENDSLDDGEVDEDFDSDEEEDSD